MGTQCACKHLVCMYSSHVCYQLVPLVPAWVLLAQVKMCMSSDTLPSLVVMFVCFCDLVRPVLLAESIMGVWKSSAQTECVGV